MASVTVYAPATIANIGPGYDVMGMAITGLGDRVSAERTEEGIVLEGVTGDNGQLPLESDANTATVAARLALEKLGDAGRFGLAMTLHKGLPLGSGLGSSAASAVAGAMCAQLLAGSGFEITPAERYALLESCCEAEAVAAGLAHADNVAPSLMGGIVLIRRYNPLEIIELPVPEAMRIIISIPSFAVSTRQAREALPEHVRLSDAVGNFGNIAAMVTGFFRGDLELVGRAMEDSIVEPVRAAIIPGYHKVKRAALAAGALGASISGAGPTCFALADCEANAGRIAVAMENAWSKHDIKSWVHIARVDVEGARLLGSSGATP